MPAISTFGLCSSPGGLSTDLANTVACSVVYTRMDYCNSLLYGAADRTFANIQSKLGRTVCDASHYLLARPLHWLPIRARSTSKSTLLQSTTYVCNNRITCSEHYKRIRVPTRSLRESDKDLLAVPQDRINTASCRFSSPSAFRVEPTFV